MQNEVDGGKILNIASLRLPILLKLRGRELQFEEIFDKKDSSNNRKRIKELKKYGLIVSIIENEQNKDVEKYALTQLSYDLLKVIKLETGKNNLTPADTHLIESYIRDIINIENQKKKSVVIDELVHLSARYIIELKSSDLQILAEILYKEKNTTNLRNLLQFLIYIIRNKPDEREKYRDVFGNKFKEIFSDKQPFSIRNDDVQKKTISFLQQVYGSDSIYEELWKAYKTSLINNGPEISTQYREIMKEYYPEKRDYIRKRLIDLYSTNDAVNQKIDTDLSQLR